MLKITFYPNDEARIVGKVYDNTTGNHLAECMLATHKRAEVIRAGYIEESNEGTIEAQIVTIRKHGAYTIPKLDRVNDVFGMIDYLYG